MRVINIKDRSVLFDDDIDYSGLPEGLQDAMRRYIEDRIQPGGFLTAVLANDLFSACDHADMDNRTRLYDIAAWLYNNVPLACYGTPEKVKDWLTQT